MTTCRECGKIPHNEDEFIEETQMCLLCHCKAHDMTVREFEMMQLVERREQMAFTYFNKWETLYLEHEGLKLRLNEVMKFVASECAKGNEQAKELYDKFGGK